MFKFVSLRVQVCHGESSNLAWNGSRWGTNDSQVADGSSWVPDTYLILKGLDPL